MTHVCPPDRLGADLYLAVPDSGVELVQDGRGGHGLSGQLDQGNQYPLKLAAALIMTIPVAIMFFVFQKRIMSNTIGAEKG